MANFTKLHNQRQACGHPGLKYNLEGRILVVTRGDGILQNNDIWPMLIL
jgi:hypothetical protein